MARVTIDDRLYEVSAEHNLLEVCLSLGMDLPYFCWHPALGSVGACRQCAVKQFKDPRDRRGRIVMACMTPASDGTRISLEDAEARTFRASVIEWLMLNHPHDCPVCDEGGECHLQDMTVMAGHVVRRNRFPKRTYRNQDLGPFVHHEMNRCIQCYRCVRFYRDYAGGKDLDVFASRDRVYFGRQQDGVLESPFSGNLVEVCPTGVFTDKTLGRHYTRKWDLQNAPSLCVHCGLGCNTIASERYGLLRRVLNRYNHEVNGYFLCDRGRFGYELVNDERRLRRPLLRGAPASREEAAEHLARLVSEGRAIGVGSPRASLETNFALRALVGAERFYAGLSEQDLRLLALVLDVTQRGPARTPSLHDVERADAVLVLGEDLEQVAPRLGLAVRQSVRQAPLRVTDALGIARWNDAVIRATVQRQRGPFFVATPFATSLDEVATQSSRAAPSDIARLGFAVASAIDPDAPAAPHPLARGIAEALVAAERPVIVAGTSLRSASLIHAATNVAWALHRRDRPAQLCLVAPEANSLGLALLGGRELEAASAAVRRGEAETVIVAENDLTRRAPPAVTDALLQARHLVVVDHLENDTVRRAELALPAATFAEGSGTFVSAELRAQRFFRVMAPAADIQDAWRWLGYETLAQAESALVAALPRLRAVLEAAPPPDLRIVGQKIPRQPHRASGRTAMTAQLDVHEPPPPRDPDSPLAHSMEGHPAPPPALIPFFWAPGWNSVQATNKYQQQVGGPLAGGDPGIRLFEPDASARPEYFRELPEPFAAPAGQVLVVPIHRLFGSEELSARAPAVAARAPEPYLLVAREAAADLRLARGDMAALQIDGVLHQMRVEIEAGVPPGVVGLYAPALAAQLPAFATLEGPP